MAKKYTKPEKLAILQEADRDGVTKVLEKYALYPATYYYWRKKFGEWVRKAWRMGQIRIV